MVHDYQLTLVPGLLQTEEYMRTLFRNSRPRRTDAEIDRDVQVRLLRQRRLTHEPTLELVAIIDESHCAARSAVSRCCGHSSPSW